MIDFRSSNISFSSPPLPLARLRHLIGDSGVVFAVRSAIQRIVSAEMEIVLRRIADRPFAGALRQHIDRQLFGDRHDNVVQRSQIGVCGDVVIHFQRRIADAPGARLAPMCRLARPSDPFDR